MYYEVVLTVVVLPCLSEDLALQLAESVGHSRAQTLTINNL